MVLSTAGFAYMASNTQPITAAGETISPVVGYDVTNVTYNNGEGSGCGGPCYINSVTFTLTAQDGTAQNHGKPAFVYVAVQSAVDSGELANTDGCAVPSGTYVGPNNAWQGTFTCTLNPANGAQVSQVNYLNITATQ